MLYKCLHIDFKLIPDKLLDSSKTAGGAKMDGLVVSLAEAKYEEARLSSLLILKKTQKNLIAPHFQKSFYSSQPVSISKDMSTAAVRTICVVVMDE